MTACEWCASLAVWRVQIVAVADRDRAHLCSHHLGPWLDHSSATLAVRPLMFEVVRITDPERPRLTAVEAP